MLSAVRCSAKRQQMRNYANVTDASDKAGGSASRPRPLRFALASGGQLTTETPVILTIASEHPESVKSASIQSCFSGATNVGALPSCESAQMCVLGRDTL